MRRAAPLLAVLLASCGAKDETFAITDVRERADGGPPPLVGRTDDDRFDGRSPHGMGEGAPPSKAGFAWELPTGWEEVPPTPPTLAAFRVTDAPGVDVTFSLLPGAAGGLLSNVNRWRKQMSLEPVEEGALATMPKETLLGKRAVVVDLEGTYVGMGRTPPVEGARLLGLVAETDGGVAFLKMTGPAALVEGQGEALRSFAASFRRGGRESAPPPSAPATRWTAPEGWEQQPERPPRLVTFVPKGAKETEVALFSFPGDAGGLRANLDLWRKQMTLPALTDDEFAALPRGEVLGKPAVFVEWEGAYAGMSGGEGKPGWLFLGMVVQAGGRSLFAKMTGPADEVRPERERFRAFCESLRE